MPPAADKNIKNTLQKSDKLKSSIEIDAIYRNNQYVVAYPLKCYYTFSEPAENKPSLRVAFAVPKKTFKLAVERNTLKRRMREAYRLNYKNIFEPFFSKKELQLKLFFIYVGNESVNFREIERNVVKILQKINDSIFCT